MAQRNAAAAGTGTAGLRTTGGAAASLPPGRLTFYSYEGDKTTEIRDIVYIPLTAVKDAEWTPERLVRTDAPVYGVTAVPECLLDQTLKSEVAALKVLTIPVKYALTNVPSGEYHGALRFTYNAPRPRVGNVTPEPLPQAVQYDVSIFVKDPPLLPCVAIFLGIVLGVGCTSYRQVGRRRDERIVRRSTTLLAIEASQRQLPQSFYEWFKARAEDIDVLITRNNWTTADQQIDILETNWQRWLFEREGWTIQLEYYNDLRKQAKQATKEAQEWSARFPESPDHDLADLAHKGPVEIVRLYQRFLRDLDDVFTVDASTTQELPTVQNVRDILDQDVSCLLALSDLTQEVGKAAALLTDVAFLSSLTNTQILAFQAGCAKAILNDLKGIADPVATATQLRLIVQSLHAVLQTAMQATTVSPAPGGALPPSIHPLASPPLAPNSLPRDPRKALDMARKNLKWFSWILYVIALLGLFYVAYQEVYDANPVFGARWRDYVTAFLWGFAGEATRTTFLSTLQEIQSPTTSAS